MARNAGRWLLTLANLVTNLLGAAATTMTALGGLLLDRRLRGA